MSLGKRIRVLCAVGLLVPCLSGCVWVAATGLFSGVNAARQERSVGNAIDDVRIKSAVQGRLERESPGSFFNVSVTVVEGRVLLTGRADNPERRISATRIAWTVEGVRQVNNEIQVTDQTGWLDRPNDIWLRTQLSAQLLGDANIRDVNYTIDVVNRVVYLMGIGQDEAEEQRVVVRAEGLSGVKRVDNFVVLKNDPVRYGYNVPTVQ